MIRRHTSAVVVTVNLTVAGDDGHAGCNNCPFVGRDTDNAKPSREIYVCNITGESLGRCNGPVVEQFAPSGCPLRSHDCVEVRGV